MRISTTHKTEDYIGKIYTNYNLAYNGKNFSESFKKFNYLFITDINNAICTFSRRYRGVTCILEINYVEIPIVGVVAIITQCRFNPIVLTRLMFQTHSERIFKGFPSTPPSLISSTRVVSDYTYYSSGGTYYGHTIDIVKKKRSSKTKPQFNYYDRDAGSIMFSFDFYSAFPFENNEAEGWATDGHKYNLPSMMLIENQCSIRENNNTEIQNTVKQTIRLTESQLRNAIRQMIKEALNETDYKTALWAAKERMKRYDQTHDKKDFEQGYNDYRAADERFRDKYVTPYQYDTLGDKMRGKHSSTFDVRFNGGSEDPTHSLRAYNKGGDKLVQSEKNNYHSSKGYTTPSKFFRDKDVAAAYQKASDELWDYSDGKYEYVKGNGWQRKDD